MKRKKYLSFILVLCLTFSGVIGVNAQPANNDSTYYLLDTETLQWNYNSNTLWQSKKMSDGYVGVWNEMDLCPGANYAVSVTLTAPERATISPTSADTSVTVFRRNAVSAENKDDGVRIAVFHNDKKIYPTDSTWAAVGETYDNRTEFTLPEITMEKGDKLRYIIDSGGVGNCSWDSVYLNAEGIYKDESGAETEYISFSQGLAYTDAASGEEYSEIGEYTKSQLISYECVSVREGSPKTNLKNNTARVMLYEDPLSWGTINDSYYWCGATTANDTYLYYDHNANGDFLTPGNTSSVAVVFTAPSDGTIDNSFGLGSFYRTFNANEPNDGTTDGARLTVIKNDTVIFPQEGYWSTAPQEGKEGVKPQNITFNSMKVKKGDKIYYIVDNGGNNNNGFDGVRMLDWGFLWKDQANPSGVWFGFGENYYNAETANEPSSLAGYKKKDVLSYLYTTVEELTPVGAAQELNALDVEPIAEDLFTPLEWKAESGEKGEFRITGDPHILVSEFYAQPSQSYMLGIKWTAEQTGRVDISKSYIQNWLYNSEYATSNGVRYKVILNNKKQILPDATGGEWIMTEQTEKSFLNVAPFAVEAGDEVLVIIDCNKQIDYDTMTAQMLFDFAADGADHTKRYNNIKSMYDTESAFSYYGIEIELSSDRYFGGNLTELTLLSMDADAGIGLLGVWIGVGVSLLVVAGGAVGVIFYIKKRKKEVAS